MALKRNLSGPFWARREQRDGEGRTANGHQVGVGVRRITSRPLDSDGAAIPWITTPQPALRRV